MGTKESGRIRALFLAGHPALDFLNTRMSVDGNLVDLLQSDEAVLFWLKQAGFPASAVGRKLKTLHLLRSARTLRENIRALIENRKRGKNGEPAILNKFLAAGSRYSQLLWSKSNKLRIETVRRQESVESMLAPIAEAAAGLLTNGNFDLVKHCENQTCLLWFFDQTKSHRRRWCRMERCGNRYKVAAYRARRREQSTPS
jgi:predicted RNA-binding Zn ribbon-like protein